MREDFKFADWWNCDEMIQICLYIKELHFL